MIICGNCGALISTVDSPVVAFCDRNCLRNWRRFGPTGEHPIEPDVSMLAALREIGRVLRDAGVDLDALSPNASLAAEPKLQVPLGHESKEV